MIIECIMFNQPQRIIESGYVVALAISVDPSVEFFKAIYHYATKHSIPIRKKRRDSINCSMASGMSLTIMADSMTVHLKSRITKYLCSR